MRDGYTRDEQLACYKKNLHHAAKELAKHNIVGVIEPINKYSLPNYFMNDYKDGKEVFNLALVLKNN